MTTVWWDKTDCKFYVCCTISVDSNIRSKRKNFESFFKSDSIVKQLQLFRSVKGIREQQRYSRVSLAERQFQLPLS